MAVTDNTDRLFPEPKPKKISKISDLDVDIHNEYRDYRSIAGKQTADETIHNCRVHTTMQVTDSSAEN